MSFNEVVIGITGIAAGVSALYLVIKKGPETKRGLHQDLKRVEGIVDVLVRLTADRRDIKGTLTNFEPLNNSEYPASKLNVRSEDNSDNIFYYFGQLDKDSMEQMKGNSINLSEILKKDSVYQALAGKNYATSNIISKEKARGFFQKEM